MQSFLEKVIFELSLEVEALITQKGKRRENHVCKNQRGIKGQEMFGGPKEQVGIIRTQPL